MVFKRNQVNLGQNGFKRPHFFTIPHSLMADSYDRMTDDPCCCWCRLRPKDLPAGAHSGIVGTALFCSFQRSHDGSWRKMRKKIILMVIGLSYSEELNYSDEFYRYYASQVIGLWGVGKGGAG